LGCVDDDRLSRFLLPEFPGLAKGNSTEA